MLKNVLTAYTVRCPQISYCQGMNFLVARILKQTVLESDKRYTESRMSLRFPSFNQFYSRATIKAAGGIQEVLSFQAEDDRAEEEAFWIFVCLMESIVPLDYYTNIIGA
jgi:hypothetical protein